MSGSAIHTFSLAEKRFCWNGVGIRTTDGGAERDMAPHRHNFFQVLFVASGHATHEASGEVTTASAGGIFFISPYTTHRISFPVDAQCYVLYIDASYLAKSILLRDFSPEDPGTYSVPEMLPFVHHAPNGYQLDERTATNVLERCNRILVACNRRGTFDAADIRSELTLLLTTVARQQFVEQACPTGRLVEPTLSRHARLALNYLKENFHQPICLGQVADTVHLNETYLTHLLKIETGKSFKPLLEQLRLEHAKDLLTHTDLPLKSVAVESGFLDQAHFGKRFKAYTNETPRAFRRRAFICWQ
jgi:AraC family transcriptional regulator, transcriptional activator of pobA